MPLLVLAAIIAAIIAMPEGASSNAGYPVAQKDDWTRDDMRAFTEHVLALARQVDMGGIPPDMAVAVAALETGWGTGRVYHNSHNLFSVLRGSVKAWPGPVFTAKGQDHRVYTDDRAALVDWVRLMHISKYAPALAKAQLKDYRGFFQELQRLGYAGAQSDPGQGQNYAAKLEARLQQALAVA